MKKYLICWWDYYQEHYHEIEAENLTDAKSQAFRMMCDFAGDRLYSVSVYEFKSSCNCQGECNPHPLSATSDRSERDYMTGKFKRR